MNSYFAYIRVSTIKQGDQGSSLQEQRDAIVSFAARHGLSIIAWFEERETAAKVGRHEFSRMVLALKKNGASGVIFHKIDRSVRNLKDWSAIQDLADQGIDVRFTQESINLGSNEGKLTGDFLAVISSHYIRNLREEVRKGIRGRLKQGLYPLAAPIGYLDQGGGKAKIPDPERAPYVRDAFELYAENGFSLRGLADELYRRGLRSKNGKKVGVNRLAVVLRNPFYVGVMRIRRSGESFAGIHEPIVPKQLFNRVQNILDGKANAKILVHDFLFRRLITCSLCGYSLIGERQKGHVYYRCHTRGCSTRSMREEVVDAGVRESLAQINLLEDETAELCDMVLSYAKDWAKSREERIRATALQIAGLNSRLSRLTDAYLDDAVEKSLFNEKKLALLLERKALEARREQNALDEQAFMTDVSECLERVITLPLTYETGNTGEKRNILKTITSNLSVDRKNVAVALRSPFQDIAKACSVPTGALSRGRPRTRVKMIFAVLIKHFTTQVREQLVKENDLPIAA